MRINAYLTFNGRGEEAIEFYKSALGAQVGMLMRFKDSPDQTGITPGMGEKVMHAALTIGSSGIMLTDGQCVEGAQGAQSFQGFSLSLAVANDAEAKEKFTALAEGGQVQMPLEPTFFATSFGVVQDRFGVTWMVIAEP